MSTDTDSDDEAVWRRDPSELSDEELVQAAAASDILSEQEAREMLGLVDQVDSRDGGVSS